MKNGGFFFHSHSYLKIYGAHYIENYKISFASLSLNGGWRLTWLCRWFCRCLSRYWMCWRFWCSRRSMTNSTSSFTIRSHCITKISFIFTKFLEELTRVASFLVFAYLATCDFGRTIFHIFCFVHKTKNPKFPYGWGPSYHSSYYDYAPILAPVQYAVQ